MFWCTMSLKSFSLIVMLFVLTFENFDVVVCPRKPSGWGSFGKGSRTPSTLDAYEKTKKSKVPRPPINRQLTSFTFADDGATADRMATGFAALNVLASMATHISVKDYVEIREFIRGVVERDLCKCGVAGLLPGNQNCLEAFTKFLRVPKDMRGGICQEAYQARCFKPEGSNDIPMCSFFVKTSPGRVKPETGHWLPLIICAQDLENPPKMGTPGANWILMGRK